MLLTSDFFPDNLPASTTVVVPDFAVWHEIISRRILFLTFGNYNFGGWLPGFADVRANRADEHISGHRLLDMAAVSNLLYFSVIQDVVDFSSEVFKFLIVYACDIAIRDPDTGLWLLG